MRFAQNRRFRQLNQARLDRVAVAELERTMPALLRPIMAAHQQFLDCGRWQRLENRSQEFLDVLSELFYVGRQILELKDSHRPHRRNRKGVLVYELHGECRRDGRIQVFLRTAARGQPVALQTLLHTILHEWVHHYDFAAFGESYHCHGFYQRLTQLYDPLRNALKQERLREA